MGAINGYVAGLLTTIWAWMLVRRDRSHKPQRSKQNLLEPWQVADQWYQTITKENTKKTSRRQA